MQNFGMTFISTSDYQEVIKLGNNYIVRLEPKQQEDGTTMCYECMTEGKPDIPQLTADLQLWKAAREEQKTHRIRQIRIQEILKELADTDYIVLKRAEGIDISEYDEKYKPNFLDWRQALRDEYNQLEEQERGE